MALIEIAMITTLLFFNYGMSIIALYATVNLFQIYRVKEADKFYHLCLTLSFLTLLLFTIGELIFWLASTYSLGLILNMAFRQTFMTDALGKYEFFFFVGLLAATAFHLAALLPLLWYLGEKKRHKLNFQPWFSFKALHRILIVVGVCSIACGTMIVYKNENAIHINEIKQNITPVFKNSTSTVFKHLPEE